MRTCETYPLTRLLGAQDAKLRRCWWCGSWAYDVDDCKVCAAPAARTALLDDRAAS